jgi:methyl-accepting chemotaxis protein
MRNLLLGSQYLQQLLQKNQDAQVKAFTRELDNAQSMVTVLRDRSDSERLIAQLPQALDNLERYKTGAAKVVELFKQRNHALAQMDWIDPQLADLAKPLQQRLIAGMQKAYSASDRNVLQGNQLLWGLLFAALVLGALLACNVGHALVHGLRQINLMLQDMADGEGDLGPLASSFNIFVEKIRQTVAEVAKASPALVQAGENLQQSAQRLPRCGTTARSKQQMACAITQMAACAQEMANRAGYGQQLSHDTCWATHDGLRCVESNRQAMQGQNEKVARLSDVIQSLSADSERIGSVLVVIGSIAQQTKMLGLNAEIEAARAGEQAEVAGNVGAGVMRANQISENAYATVEKLVHLREVFAICRRN